MKSIYAILLAIVSLSSCSADEQGQKTSSQKWLITFSSKDIGSVQMIMYFNFSDSTFTAHTPEKADKKILGPWKSFLGRLFTKKFRNGSLLRIAKGKCYDSSRYKVFKGILVSSMSNYYINGSAIKDTLNALIRDGKMSVKGRFSGSRNNTFLPLRNYPVLIEKALATTKEKIYSRKAVNSKEWNKFERKIKKLAQTADDDLELVFGFFYYASQLPFSHYALYRENYIPFNTSDKESRILLEQKENNTVYLKINSFAGDAGEMDSVMQKVMVIYPAKLIIDMRDNPGGNIAPAMVLSSYLVDTTYIGGVFLTQKWFDAHKEIPGIREYTALRSFSEASYDLIIDGIHREDALVLTVNPGKQHYRGDVYVLINNKTASTCEPLVYALKQYHLATVIGQRSAGAMLNGEMFDVGSGFKLVVPTADYYTSDRYKIDQQGVEPDVIQDAPLQYVLGLQ